MIIVWYNSKKDIYYAKYNRLTFIDDRYKVGYSNQYGHRIICMFYIQENGKLISCNSFSDYHYNKSSLKKRLINHLIDWLNKHK